MSREEAMHQDFDSMTDEDIALLAQQGDADASEIGRASCRERV